MTGFALRAPWYLRERCRFDLRDPRALRPTLQKYSSPEFVDQVLADPRDSLQFLAEDRWSYPVPVHPTKAHGRERFATFKLHTTKMRKLFQPTHDRFYTIVVEVFCDEPGLPRAGQVEDLEVGFVMRRQQTTLKGDPKTVCRLARRALIAASKEKYGIPPRSVFEDSLDVYNTDQAWAEQVQNEADWKQAFAERNVDLLAGVEPEHKVQAWMVHRGRGGWRDLGAAPPAGEPAGQEEEFVMWRVPSTAAGCEDAQTRSLWFGVIPTFSGEHWVGPGADKPMLPKLDDHEIYELVCFVREPPPEDKPDCPPRMWWSKPTRPFRLAAPLDPDGTKNHTVTITAPDLRRLAARAGQKLGTGGARIVTPPRSGLPPPPFAALSNPVKQNLSAGGSICSFAFELFFMVALFLFLMFLPIIVFLFQLWWMLALRFCLPPSASFEALAEFVADGNDLADATPAIKADIDNVLQLPGAADLLKDIPLFKKPDLATQSAFPDLVAAIDPTTSAGKPKPPVVLDKPDDPLCSTTT